MAWGAVERPMRGRNFEIESGSRRIWEPSQAFAMIRSSEIRMSKLPRLEIKSLTGNPMFVDIGGIAALTSLSAYWPVGFGIRRGDRHQEDDGGSGCAENHGSGSGCLSGHAEVSGDDDHGAMPNSLGGLHGRSWWKRVRRLFSRLHVRLLLPRDTGCDSHSRRLYGNHQECHVRNCNYGGRMHDT